MRGGIAVAKIGRLDEKRPSWCPGYPRWNLPFRSILITHEDGTKAEYWHLDSIARRLLDSRGNPLSNGAETKQGEYLGEMGSSGCASGPHLHIIKRSSFGKVDRIAGTIMSANIAQGYTKTFRIVTPLEVMYEED